MSERIFGRFRASKGMRVSEADQFASHAGSTKAKTDESASELAQGLSRLVEDASAFSTEAASDLARMLEHSLANPSIGERRHLRIGLLVDLVAGTNGEFVDSSGYEAERARRVKTGEEWPSASGLTRAYGHWLKGGASGLSLLVRGRRRLRSLRPLSAGHYCSRLRASGDHASSARGAG